MKVSFRQKKASGGISTMSEDAPGKDWRYNQLNNEMNRRRLEILDLHRALEALADALGYSILEDLSTRGASSTPIVRVVKKEHLGG